MCKLLVGIKLNNESEAEFENILRAQQQDLETQRDGIATMIVKEDGEVKVRRGLTNYNSILQETFNQVPEARLVGIHTRIQSHGLVNLENTHFYEKNDYLFAHNGYIYEYTGYGEGRWNANTGYHATKKERKKAKKADKQLQREANEIRSEVLAGQVATIEEAISNCVLCKNEDEPCTEHFNDAVELTSLREKLEQSKGTLIMLPENKTADSKTSWPSQTYRTAKKSDSLQFLENMPADISNAHQLRAYAELKRFSGVACLYNKRTGKLYIIATRKVKVHTNFKDYIILYSYEPTNSIPTIRPFLGLPIIANDETDIETHELPAAVYTVDIEQINQAVGSSGQQ